MIPPRRRTTKIREERKTGESRQVWWQVWEQPLEAVCRKTDLMQLCRTDTSAGLPIPEDSGT